MACAALRDRAWASTSAGMGVATGKNPISTGTWIAVIAACVLFYLLRKMLVPFIIVAVLAYITAPIIRLLQSHLRFPRLLASLLVYVVLLAILLSSGLWGYAVLSDQVSDVAVRLPDMLHSVLTQILGDRPLALLGGTVTATTARDWMLARLTQWLSAPAQAAQVVTISFDVMAGIFLSFVLLFYFLVDGPRLLRGALWLVPPSHRKEVHALALDVNPMLGRYLRGLVVIVAYTFGATWLGIGLFLHLPNALLLAVATAALELIPVIGPILAAVMLGMAALEQGSIYLALGYVVFAIMLRLSIDQVVAPLVLGRAVTLHPVVVIFALFSGGILLGMVGILLAVPAAASVKIVLARHYGQMEHETRQAAGSTS